MRDALEQREEPAHRQRAAVELAEARAVRDARPRSRPRVACDHELESPSSELALAGRQVGVAHAHAVEEGAVERARVGDAPARCLARERQWKRETSGSSRHDVVARVRADADALAVDLDLTLHRFAGLPLDRYSDSRYGDPRRARVGETYAEVGRAIAVIHGVRPGMVATPRLSASGRRSRRGSQRSPSACWAAWTVRSMSSVPCASETKAASNCEGGK